MVRSRFTPSSFARVGIPAVTLANVKAIKMGLRKAAEAGKALAIAELQRAKPRPPIDTGELARSYAVQAIADGWRLVNTAPHAGHMEHGTKAHTPPFAPLLAWAMRKVRGAAKRARTTAGKKQQGQARSPRAAQPQQAARKQSKQQQKAAQELARRAWAAIRKRGIPGRHFHAAAATQFDALAKKHVQAELKRVGRS